MQEIAGEGRRIAALKSSGSATQGYAQWCWHSGEITAGKFGGGTSAPWKGFFHQKMEQMEACLNVNCFDLGF